MTSARCNAGAMSSATIAVPVAGKSRQAITTCKPRAIRARVSYGPTSDEAPVTLTVGFGQNISLGAFRGTLIGDQSARDRYP